ncbi:MAG: lipocalin family protein, partial [Victivallaceae bacterium]
RKNNKVIMKKTALVAMIGAATLLCSCFFSTQQKDNAPYDPPVNLESYQGLWFQVAGDPTRFQKPCIASAIEYRLCHNKNGVPYLKITDTCITSKQDFPEVNSIGRVYDHGYNRRLAVNIGFFGTLKGLTQRYNYVIYYVSPDYTEAIVCSPNKKYIRILARTPFISSGKEKKLMDIAKSFDIDVLKLQKDSWNESLYEKIKDRPK